MFYRFLFFKQSNDAVDMISISSLAQRFRPRPAVLPSTPATGPVTASQQHQPSSSNLLSSTLALTANLGGSRSSSSQGDSSSLVGDPILGGPSHSRFTTQDSSLGTFPMHVLTPIVSYILSFYRFLKFF